jgi:hypothetical protein
MPQRRPQQLWLGDRVDFQEKLLQIFDGETGALSQPLFV